jgi:hypothetical protein
MDRLSSQGAPQQASTEAQPVTPQPGPTARESSQTRQEKTLTGKITNVDTEESMAEISLGSADGVKDGMIFYVIRDDEFVCELHIIDVEPETAVGAIERMQYQPKSGDKATNTL